MSVLEQEADAAGETMDPAFGPDPQAASAAREQLAPYTEANALRSVRAEELRRLQGFASELRQLEADLLNVGSLSDEERTCLLYTSRGTRANSTQADLCRGLRHAR